MKRTRTLLLIASFMLGAALFCQAQGAGITPPDFTVTDITGAEHTLSKLKGSVVLLDFWATWCPPCRVEVPHLIDIQKRFGDRKFVLISISLDRDLEAARRFVKDKGMDWVHVIDRQAARELAEKYEVSFIPSTFVIDRGGKIAATQLRGNGLKDRIAALLK
jgi:thiol-disulfide isomerase/thioredoxin